MANNLKELHLTEEDLEAIELNAGRGAHHSMMNNSSVKGGARKSKKAYDRKRQKKEWQ